VPWPFDSDQQLTGFTIRASFSCPRMQLWKIQRLGLNYGSVFSPIPCSRLRTSSSIGAVIIPTLTGLRLILLRATHVPVGEDQRQHLEFSRYTANSFNHLYGPIFPVPEALICKSLPRLDVSMADLTSSCEASDVPERAHFQDVQVPCR
jgi:tryptophanyl-tRNA synthetase